ncbi:hypothetical protein N7G274_006651 [Stereocaulon virgatum]|uniref:Uncharacterized protein n=1 Tax=Stereocaulon virgatum TaxID=373712 RepID=A0ABR4A432_9LECA
MIIKRTGRSYWLAALPATVATLGTIPFAVAPSLNSVSLPTIYIGSVISLVPQGIIVTSSLVAVIFNVSAADQAVATACAFLFRSLGAAVGVCLVGVLIQNVLRLRLHASLEPEEADRILKGIAQGLEFIEGLPPSLRTTCLVLLVVVTLSVFWWRENKLSN